MATNGGNTMKGASSVVSGRVFIEAGCAARIVHQQGEWKHAPNEGEQAVVSLVEIFDRLLVDFTECDTHGRMRVLLMATSHARGQYKGCLGAQAGQHVGAQLNVWIGFVLVQRCKVFLYVGGCGNVAG